MKIAGLFGKVRGGGWVTLATPETPLMDQKQFLKKLKQENGRSILVSGKRIDLEEAVLFVSGSGKWIGFKEPVKTASSGPDTVPNIAKLAEALGVTIEEAGAMSKKAGFPKKEKEGYNVGAIKEWLNANLAEWR